MTQAAYVQPLDYANYGIADAVYEQVDAASRLVDGFLGRPEGLLWLPDASGQPGWMAALTSTKRYFLPAAVVAGSAIRITLTGVKFGLPDVGQVVVLDRRKKTAAEACVVTAASGDTITLDSVGYDHASGASIEFGLTLLQEVNAPGVWKTIRIARTPVARLLAGFGRSGRVMHRDYDPFAHLASTGGGWTAFDTADCDVNESTGVVRAIPGLPQSGFTEIRLRYVAGWDYPNLPDGIKRATAMIVRNFIDADGIPGNVRLAKSGDATIERFADVPLDSKAVVMLSSYRLLRLA